MFRNLIVAFSLLASSGLIAEENFPMIRFWRGYTSAETTPGDYEKFYTLLNTLLIPETIKVGSQQDTDHRGLLAYAPSALDWDDAAVNLLPKEMAVLVYASPEHYDRIRKTDAGKKYGPLHFNKGLFVKDSNGRASGSLVATRFTGKIELELNAAGRGTVAKPAVYFVGDLPPDWQSGLAITRATVSKNAQDPTIGGLTAQARVQYYQDAATRQKLGILYAMVLTDKDSLIEYIVCETEEKRQRLMDSQTLARLDDQKGLKQVGILSHEHQQLPNAQLSSGSALTVRFDPNPKVDCPDETANKADAAGQISYDSPRKKNSASHRASNKNASVRDASDSDTRNNI